MLLGRPCIAAFHEQRGSPFSFGRFCTALGSADRQNLGDVLGPWSLAKANYCLAHQALASTVRVTGRAILEVAQSAASSLGRFAFERRGMALWAKTGALIGVAGRCYQRPWSGSRHGPRWQRLRRERCSWFPTGQRHRGRPGAISARRPVAIRDFVRLVLPDR